MVPIPDFDGALLTVTVLAAKEGATVEASSVLEATVTAVSDVFVAEVATAVSAEALELL